MSAEILRRAASMMRYDCPIPATSRGYDFIDFPTGWAIQQAGVEHADSRCSAVQTSGAMLCDCQAIYPPWRRWKALLAVADWLDAEYAACKGDDFYAVEPALVVARAYLGSEQ